MKKYGCKPCNFETDNKNNYTKHKETEKHIEKNIEIEELQKQNALAEILLFICNYCNKSYSTAGNLVRHDKLCPSKNSIISELKKDYELKIMNITNENLVLKKDVKYLNEKIIDLNDKIELITANKDDKIINLNDKIEFITANKNEMKSIINFTGKIAVNAMSAIQYLTHNYSPPAIKLFKPEEYPKIEYIVELLNNDETHFVRDILFQADNANLHEYLGNIIVKLYKTDDPEEQSVWNSDVPRLSYVMREKIGDQELWTADKSGVKISELIIKPFLKYILTLIQKHMMNIQPKFEDSFMQIEKSNEEMDKCLKIRQSIEDNKPNLTYEINKYIAAHFFLSNKQNLGLITEK